jgi:hypothetical protein
MAKTDGDDINDDIGVASTYVAVAHGSNRQWLGEGGEGNGVVAIIG